MGEDIYRDLRIQLFARPFDFEGGLEEIEEIMQMVDRARNEFVDRINETRTNICPHCKKKMGDDEFSKVDRSYRDEFNISGLCVVCQDEIFAETETDNDCD